MKKISIQDLKPFGFYITNTPEVFQAIQESFQVPEVLQESLEALQTQKAPPTSDLPPRQLIESAIQLIPFDAALAFLVERIYDRLYIFKYALPGDYRLEDALEGEDVYLWGLWCELIDLGVDSPTIEERDEYDRAADLVDAVIKTLWAAETGAVGSIILGLRAVQRAVYDEPGGARAEELKQLARLKEVCK